MVNPEQDLWRSVAIMAVQDEIRNVRHSMRNGMALNNAIQRAMTYFHSEDWRIVTELAGISMRQDRIRKVLRNCATADSVTFNDYIGGELI